MRPLLIGLAFGVLLGLAYMTGQRSAMEAGPRLIGYGCEGAGGDLWASEESDFPRCEEIGPSY